MCIVILSFGVECIYKRLRTMNNEHKHCTEAVALMNHFPLLFSHLSSFPKKTLLNLRKTSLFLYICGTCKST